MGIALLVLAVVGAIVLGARHQKLVAGSATPASLTEAPKVGDCVLEPLPDWQQPPEMSEVAPCGQRKFGEVVAVMPGSLNNYLASMNTDRGDDPVTPEGTCVRVGSAFLGLPSTAADPRTHPTTWYPSPSIGMQVVQPNALARRFGADWTACVVRIFSNSTSSGPSYTGTLAAVNTTFGYPPEAATCWRTMQKREWPPVSCRTPHAVEEFGSVGDLDPTMTSASSLHGSCLQLVSRMTGKVDPTAGGVLLIRVVLSGSYLSDQNSTVTLVNYSCLVEVRPGEQLTGPLLNLEDGPIPLR